VGTSATGDGGGAAAAAAGWRRPHRIRRVPPYRRELADSDRSAPTRRRGLKTRRPATAARSSTQYTVHSTQIQYTDPVHSAQYGCTLRRHFHSAVRLIAAGRRPYAAGALSSQRIHRDYSCTGTVHSTQIQYTVHSTQIQYTDPVHSTQYTDPVRLYMYTDPVHKSRPRPRSHPIEGCLSNRAGGDSLIAKAIGLSIGARCVAIDNRGGGGLRRWAKDRSGEGNILYTRLIPRVAGERR
jgi:hypothetical protein